MRAVASLVLSLSLAAGASTAMAQTVWKFSTWVPPTHPIVELVWKPWMAQVEQATQGRVRIEMIPPLGTPQAHYDLVRNGVADVGNISIAYTASRFPLIGALELPFLSDSTLVMSVAAWRTYEKHFKQAGEFRGVKLASLMIAGPYHVFTTEKKIETINDLRGLKLRESGGISKEVVERIGATPFFAPSPQVYDVLSRRVADGVLYATEAIVGFNVTKAIKYTLEVPGGIHQSAQAMLINEAKWNALSAQDQAAIEKTMGENFARLWGQAWAKTTASAETILRKEGVVFSKASGSLLSDLQSKLRPVEEQWIAAAQKKNVDGKAALAFMRDEIRRIEAGGQ
ncbi:MAG: TRAP transporter substrate-binding protein [Burkholderiaceae bacterium]